MNSEYMTMFHRNSGVATWLKNWLDWSDKYGNQSMLCEIMDSISASTITKTVGDERRYLNFIFESGRK